MKRWLKITMIALLLGLFTFGVFGTGVAVGIGGTSLFADDHIEAGSLQSVFPKFSLRLALDKLPVPGRLRQ